MLMGYWKRFAASGIGFAHKYRFDPFFRTEINVIALQFALAGFLLAVVGIIASQLYHDASAAVAQGIADAIKPNSSPASIGSAVTDQLSSMRSRTVMIAGAAVILITALFTYIIARLALSPTRNALQSQKQFIGNVAHELRTPLAVAKTNMEVGLMVPALSADVQRTFKETVGELDRMSEIINNLLSLSAFTRPERIEFTDVDLGAVVEHAMRKLHGLAEPKKLEIELRLSERRAVWGNQIGLEQIVMNLIKNAIIYSGRGARVTVTVEPVYPDFMELRVRDSGRGITRKDLFHIFEPYYRGDPSRQRGSSGGSGLGLTIVSELVKLHNGRITVRSAEGRGTTVTLLLPAGKTAVGREIVAHDQDTVSEIAVDYSHHNGRRS
jgi:two-component system sensor histidine kinase ResE